MEWLAWATRAIGAGVAGLVGASLLIAAAVISEGNAVVFCLGVAGCVGAFVSWPRTPNAWRRDPPSVKQLRYAADLGIRVRRGATKGEVSDAISAATGR